MKQTTRIAIAGLLSSAGSVLTALAAEFGGEEGTPAATPEAPKTRKPREAKAAATPAEPAAETPAASEEPKDGTEGGEATGKTYDELRALIEPLVKGGQGPEVKKLIAKYDPSDPPALKTMPARNHAAFERDLAALGY